MKTKITSRTEYTLNPKRIGKKSWGASRKCEAENFNKRKLLTGAVYEK